MKNSFFHQCAGQCRSNHKVSIERNFLFFSRAYEVYEMTGTDWHFQSDLIAEFSKICRGVGQCRSNHKVPIERFFLLFSRAYEVYEMTYIDLHLFYLSNLGCSLSLRSSADDHLHTHCLFSEFCQNSLFPLPHDVYKPLINPFLFDV